MTNPQPLKPCPKCGSNYLIEDYGPVLCKDCGYQESKETWNHRPEEDRLNRELTAAREEIKRLKHENATQFEDQLQEISALQMENYNSIMTPHPTCETCGVSSCTGKTIDRDGILTDLTYCDQHTELKGKG